jgi:hypothetical protein
MKRAACEEKDVAAKSASQTWKRREEALHGQCKLTPALLHPSALLMVRLLVMLYVLVMFHGTSCH